MKKFVSFFFVVLVAAASQASYLYWQVDSDLMRTYNATTANLYVTSSSDIFDSLITPGVSQSIDVSAFDSNPTGHSFYIELVNSTGGVVATSDRATYASLADYITTDSLSIPRLNAWHGGTFTAAPEPSSAVLMLIGLAGLALKRRNV